MVGQEDFELANVFHFLLFQLDPEGSEIKQCTGVGDVLIVTPKGVQPATEIVDHIVIVVGHPLGFPQVFDGFLEGLHSTFSLPSKIKSGDPSPRDDPTPNALSVTVPEGENLDPDQCLPEENRFLRF